MTVYEIIEKIGITPVSLDFQIIEKALKSIKDYKVERI